MDKVKQEDIKKKYFEWNVIAANSKVPIKILGYDVPVHTIDGEKWELLDSHVWSSRINHMCTGIDKNISTNHSKYCPIPNNVEIQIHMMPSKETVPDVNNMEKEITNHKGIADVDNECIEVRTPRWKFKDIYIDHKVLDTIERTLTIAKFKEKLFHEWNLGNGSGNGRAIVLNFYGPSGTGKSMTGEAIAGELGKKLYAVNYPELESKYVGETPKNIKKVFDKAQSEDAVLIFDEADSFLGKRLTNVTQSADYGVNITRSVMLLELEKFSGIVIFTTNLEKNYDEAFKRRILADIPFSMPDRDARKAIWDIYLNRGMPLNKDITSTLFADKYLGISGADIKDITLYAAVSALRRGGDSAILDVDDFDSAYDTIIQRKNDKNMHIRVEHEMISEEQYKEENNNGCDSSSNKGI